MSQPEAQPKPPRKKALWIARREYRIHTRREKRLRRRGYKPYITTFPGYGSSEWVRVLGRVLISKPGKQPKKKTPDAYANVRGWRSFRAVPVGLVEVEIEIAGEKHRVTADRGGVIDAIVPAKLAPGWQSFTIKVEDNEPELSRVFIISDDVRFGIICDVDDTVMVTSLPRPFVAAWNSFILAESARQAVPGMAVLLQQAVRSQAGTPMIYLSTGAWNVGRTLMRFFARHVFPPGALLLTDWGPTHDRWFRSGREHKETNLNLLASQFPNIRWLLVGDDGQHDDEIYTNFSAEHPDNVAAVAIREMSPGQAFFAGGRTAVNDHAAAAIPWVSAPNGAELLERLKAADVLPE